MQTGILNSSTKCHSRKYVAYNSKKSNVSYYKETYVSEDLIAVDHSVKKWPTLLPPYVCTRNREGYSNLIQSKPKVIFILPK